MGDHKPLEVLLDAVGTHHRESNIGDYGYKNNRPRIVYQPGIQNAVDFLSRKPVTTNTPRDPVEDYVSPIVVDSLPCAMTLQNLPLASESDPTLQTIKDCLDTGNWSAAPAPFTDLKEELCQRRGIILRNSRIIIPDALSPYILQLAHEGNQGITNHNESGGLASIFKQTDIYANALVAKLSAQIVPQSPSEWQIHQSKRGT